MYFLESSKNNSSNRSFYEEEGGIYFLACYVTFNVYLGQLLKNTACTIVKTRIFLKYRAELEFIMKTLMSDQNIYFFCNLQESLTRYVSISLVGNPNLENAQDNKRKKIIELCNQVAEFDPEFILKVRINYTAVRGPENLIKVRQKNS